jgi:hypothetical protein
MYFDAHSMRAATAFRIMQGARRALRENPSVPRDEEESVEGICN